MQGASTGRPRSTQSRGTEQRAAVHQAGAVTASRAPRTARRAPGSGGLAAWALPGMAHAARTSVAEHAQTEPALPAAHRLGMASAQVMPGLPVMRFATPHAVPALDPEVWLIAMATPSGGMHSLEGAGRAGAIRVSRPFGHLRALHPVTPPGTFSGGASAALDSAPMRGARTSARPGLGAASSATRVPAPRPLLQIVSAVEIETDTGVFRVERPYGVLGHSDLAWALASLESGEPDSQVPLPRRQVALLLTLLPPPEDPLHPEADPQWGWAHRLRGPWERGPLHQRGRLGKLVAMDPDPTGRGMHRACFELLGAEEVVWALGVPCFRAGSVYELVPLARGGVSRWLSWPLNKSRAKGTIERPAWEIARVVYRVGAPRWPLAGVVEPLGPMGTAG